MNVHKGSLLYVCMYVCSFISNGNNYMPNIKVFESYLLCTMQDFLFTSELQFGFKANKGCRDAMSVLCNTRDGSIVNITCLDMSTAFDRVNFYALSSKLVKLSVPKSFISIILDWYGKVLVSVKWNNSVSAPRRLLAGVRQGGVLSPSLFNVYVNDILCNLEHSEFRCHVSGRYVGALMYADDLLLISITLQDLRNMLDIVYAELSWLDMVLNVKKSGLLRIGPRFNADLSPVLINGSTLPVVDRLSYFGVEIGAGKSLKLYMYTRRMKFFRAFNALYAKLGGTASDIVIVHLTRTFCLPILLYGLESFTSV